MSRAMVSRGEQIVMLHGFTGTARIWDGVADALRPDYEVHALAALGHRGGRALPDGQAYTINLIADGLEEDLNTAGLRRPHILGNSLGGWLAVELAARGRASSVLALCPAGFWNGPEDPDHARIRRIFARNRRQAALSRPLLRVAFALAPVRRYAFRGVARHGDRLARAAALEAVTGTLECRAYPSLLQGSSRAGVTTPYRLSCPVAVLLGEHDRYFPPARYTPQIAERLPDAQIKVLPGVGHIPMIDDPLLIAAETRQWIARSQSESARAEPRP